MKSRLTLLSIFMVLFFVSDLLGVGALYVRPRGSNQQYQKMWIKKIDVNSNIQDQVAVTKVDQIFFNEMSTSVEAVYLFPLPENAMITELNYWFNGQKYSAKIREREEAIAAYNQKLSQWLDPALLEYLGDNLFRLKIVPINAQTEVRTEITYVEMLNYNFGVNNYKFLLNTLELSSKPLETVQFSLNAKSQAPYKYFSSPSHENSSSTQLTKLSDYNYQLEFGDENFYPNSDLEVEFETIRDNVQFNVLTYSPTIQDSMGNENFYALWITPPDSISESETIPKNIVFTVDVSSSMNGERVYQLKESLHEFIDQLTTFDKFNIITFGTYVDKFKPDLILADQFNVNAAHSFVDQIYALGMTNISAALDSSLSQSFGDESSNNIVFLTDGKPTKGITEPDSILSFARKMNTQNVRIFTFGIGDNLSKALLTQLSIQNKGYATYIDSDEVISLLIKNHFLRISSPIITDLNLDFGSFVKMDTYPKIFSDLYWGNQTMQMGLYPTGGSAEITLNGTIRNQNVQYTKLIEFPDSGGFRFVPRLWAKAKINHLLDLIDINGENDELVEQILELSLQFQILTKYTALYVDPEEDVTRVDDENNMVNEFYIEQNYPNPFNPVTQISYNLPVGKSGYNVTVKIYDVLGRLIETLVNDYKKPGRYTVSFNGESLSSGIYYYTIQVYTTGHADNFVATKKMILMK